MDSDEVPGVLAQDLSPGGECGAHPL